MFWCNHTHKTVFFTLFGIPELFYPEPSSGVGLVDHEIVQGGLYALRCPECGGGVVVRHLVVEDEQGCETVFLFNCTDGDFSLAATAKTLDEIVAETVARTILARPGKW